jgi:small subunit ribosomal protein S5
MAKKMIEVEEKDFPDADNEVIEAIEEEMTPEQAAQKMADLVEEKERAKEEKERAESVANMDRVDRKRETPEERYAREEKEKLEAWVPKTELGREVRAGKIKNIEEIFESGRKIMESEIVDTLLDLKVDLLDIGQAKGKFGGGKRRAWRQTQKKTEEGNVLTFTVMAVVGDGKGHVGIGCGRAAETLPAKEKAIRQAKLNIQKIKRGCGSFDDLSNDEHSIPFEVEGKCSSVRIKLMPAPHGTGLVAGNQVKKILKAVGIQNIYSKSYGSTCTTINTAKACMDALEKLNRMEL